MTFFILVGVAIFVHGFFFMQSYESKMNRVYKRTSEDLNFNRGFCRRCGK